MFSKSALLFTVFLSMGMQAHAHAAFFAALGVDGTPVRGDVQRPSESSPCGTISLDKIDSSTPIPVDSSGVLNPNVINFNGGTDGSRAIGSMLISQAGTANFTTLDLSTVTKNGVENPTDETTEQLTITLPSNITCTGGQGNDSCIISIANVDGFGNCIVAQQSGGSGGAGAAGADAGGAGGADAGGADGAAATGDNGGNGGDNGGNGGDKSGSGDNGGNGGDGAGSGDNGKDKKGSGMKSTKRNFISVAAGSLAARAYILAGLV